MIKQNISDQNPSGDKTTVKGDNSHVMFYLFMIEAAMVAAFITLIFRRRLRS